MHIHGRIGMAATVVGVGILAAACGGSTSAPALVPGSASLSGMAPQRVGVTLGLLYAPILTKEPAGAVVLKRISVSGRGVGTVIRVLSIQIVPTLNGKHSIAMGAYHTNPPVELDSGVCHSAVLRPVDGYRIPAGGWVRLFVVYQTIREGAWHSPNIVVTYQNHGTSHTQSLPYGFSGSVSGSAPRPSLPSFERACISHTKLL